MGNSHRRPGSIGGPVGNRKRMSMDMNQNKANEELSKIFYSGSKKIGKF